MSRTRVQSIKDPTRLDESGGVSEDTAIHRRARGRPALDVAVIILPVEVNKNGESNERTGETWGSRAGANGGADAAGGVDRRLRCGTANEVSGDKNLRADGP